MRRGTGAVAAFIVVAVGIITTIPAAAQGKLPEFQFPKTPADLLEAVPSAVEYGLSLAGVELSRYPTLRSAIWSVAGLQVLRFDSLVPIQVLSGRFQGLVEKATGVDFPALLRVAVDIVLGLLEALFGFVKRII